MQNPRHELQKPLARNEGLVYTRLKDELVIYDMERHKAHSLNRVATLVWEHCDGQTSVQELGEVLTRALQERVDEQIVWLALRQLERNWLLEGKLLTPSNLISRREAARRFGIVAGIVLPLVMTAVVPTALAGCITPLGGSGAPCGADCECASGTCLNGHCT